MSSGHDSGGIALLCGRSFSGKSTVALELAQQLPAVVVSLDAMNAERGLTSGDGLTGEDSSTRTRSAGNGHCRDSVRTRTWWWTTRARPDSVAELC